MEMLNKQELLESENPLAKKILETKLINLDTVESGKFIFTEVIDGVSYLITLKYNEMKDVTFDIGCKVKEILSVNNFSIGEKKLAFNRDRKKILVFWQNK